MRLSKNPYKVSIILGAVLFVPLLTMIIGVIVSRHQARIALDEANQEVFVEWFEASEIALQYALLWQESGLVGLGILDQDQVNAVMSSPEFEDFTRGEEGVPNIEKLLTGGFPIIVDTGFNAERFRTAISDINWILNELDIDIKIQESWNELIRGN